MSPWPSLMQAFRAAAVRLKMLQKPVADLTEQERFAICVAAGVPIKSRCVREGDSMKFIMETEQQCGIVLDRGEYRVYVREK